MRKGAIILKNLFLTEPAVSHLCKFLLKYNPIINGTTIIKLITRINLISVASSTNNHILCYSEIVTTAAAQPYSPDNTKPAVLRAPRAKILRPPNIRLGAATAI